MGKTSMRRHLRRSVALTAAVAAGAWPALTTRAATDTWQGGSATTPTWDQTANWSLGAKPGTGDDAVFPTPIPTTPGATIGLGAGETANTLTFNAAYTLGTAAGTGDLTLTTNGVSVASGITASIASQLKGTAGLAVTGGGILNLTNTTATTTTTFNSFTGGTSVTGGSTLSFSADVALGSATGNNITLDNGTLATTHTTGTVTTTATRILTIGAGGGTIAAAAGTSGTNGKLVITGPQLTGSGPFTKSGGGDLQITTASPFTGSFAIFGLVEASASGALGSGPVTLNKAAELSIGSSSNLTNSFTIGAAGSGANPIISPINSTTTISGPINTAGNPFTVALRDFNNAANARSIIFSGALSGAGALTTTAATAGSATLQLNGNNAAYSGTITVAAGTGVSFGTSASKGTGTLSVTSTATALGAVGVGSGFVPSDQSALPIIDANGTGTFGGVFTVNATGFTVPLDLNTLYGTSSSPTGGTAGLWFLGSATTGSYTAPTLGASSDTNYRLGGGGGTLTVSNAVLIGANNLIVGSTSLNGTGTVVLSANNPFTGTVTVNGGTLSVADVANGGTASPLGAGTSAITLAGATANLTYSAAASDSTDRGITLGAGGGTVTVSTAAATLTVGPLSGTGTLTKAGAGVLTAAGPANAAGGVTVSAGTVNLNGATNAAGAVTVSAGTLNFNGTTSNTGTSLTTSGGTVNANQNVSFSAASSINGTTTIATTNTTAVTFNAAVTVGANTAAALTLGTDSSFVMNAAAANFVFANRTSVGANINDTFNAAAARNVSITAAVVQVGTTTGNPDHTGTGPAVTFTLPTGAASTSTITAGTSIVVGLGETNGAGTTTFNLGGGTNTIRTPLISLGEEKTPATFQFQAGSAGSLSLQAAAGGKTNLLIGDNANSGTGTNPSSVFNLTTTGTVTAALGTITLANTTNNSATNGGSKGTFTLAASGAGSAVTADTVFVGVNTTGTTFATTSTFNLSAGTFTFNSAGTGFVQGTGTVTTRNLAINVSGGVLDMNGKPINAVGTSALALTGGVIANAGSIGNFGTLTFTGGTLRDAATVARSVTQTGATSRLEVTAAAAGAGTSIAGNYTLTAGTASVTAGKTLSITGDLALDPAAGGTLAVDLSGASSGQLALTGSGQMGLTSTTSDVLSLTALTPITTQTTYTIATFVAPAAGDADFESVLINGTPAQSGNPAGANFVTVAYNPTSIQVTVNNVAAVPEPAAAGLFGLAAVGLLSRRRRRNRRPTN